MMNEAIAKEMVRLIKEIQRDELELLEARQDEARFNTSVFKREYTIKAEFLEKSIDRKMQMLSLIQR